MVSKSIDKQSIPVCAFARLYGIVSYAPSGNSYTAIIITCGTLGFEMDLSAEWRTA